MPKLATARSVEFAPFPHNREPGAVVIGAGVGGLVAGAALAGRALADSVCEAIRGHGGRVLTRRRVAKIVRERGEVVAVETDDGHRFEATQVIANLTPWNLRALLDPAEGPLPDALAELDNPERDIEGAWGAVVAHVGIDAAVVDARAPLHHQVHLESARSSEPGAPVFISISPSWDHGRAPPGKRAVTISTHAKLGPWWERLARDPHE